MENKQLQKERNKNHRGNASQFFVAGEFYNSLGLDCGKAKDRGRGSKILEHVNIKSGVDYMLSAFVVDMGDNAFHGVIRADLDVVPLDVLALQKPVAILLVIAEAFEWIVDRALELDRCDRDPSIKDGDAVLRCNRGRL